MEGFKESIRGAMSAETKMAEAPVTSNVEATNENTKSQQSDVQEKKVLVGAVDNEKVDSNEAKAGEESKAKEEKSEEVKQSKTSSKNDLSFKADGKMVEVSDMNKLKEYASYGYHASEKLRDAKLKEMQLNNLMNDPEALINQLQSKGFDISKYAKKFSGSKSEEPELQLFPINPEVDLDSEIQLKTTMNKVVNDLTRKLQYQDQVLNKLNDNHETSNWMMQFKNTQNQYAESGYSVPDNAAMAISALMNSLQQKYGNQYTTSQYMQGAFKEYVDALPNYNLSEDVIKANPTIYDKIRRDIIAEYNADEEKRKAESHVPKVSGKMPTIEIKESEVEGAGSFRTAMQKTLEKIRKK